MPSSTSDLDSHEPRRIAALWIGVLTGPVIALVLLETNYVLSYVACEVRATWFLHVTSLVAGVLIAAAGWMAWRSGPAGTTEHPSRVSDDWARWLSAAGVSSSLLFLLVVLSMEVPTMLLKVCQ